MSRYGTTPGRPEEYRQQGEKAVRPRDAATLIIVQQAEKPRVLLGKRSMKHKFMPGKFVFPGGRLDYIDQRIKGTIRTYKNGIHTPASRNSIKRFGRQTARLSAGGYS